MTAPGGRPISSRAVGPAGGPPTRAPVVVVGSINIDLVVKTNERPVPGETVLGTGYEEVIGGKGLNQALAAARLGPAAIVGAIGSDEAGVRVQALLTERGVVRSGLEVVEGPTGRAVITVTPDGENSIVVVPLANGRVQVGGALRALDSLGGSVVLVQRELPGDVVSAAAGWAHRCGARFVFNPSPVSGVPDRLLRHADPVIVNVHEARAILHRPRGGTGAELAQSMLGRARSVVVTAGGEGCWVASGVRVEHVAAVRVETVVDTTGAGDEFAGSLASHLADGATLSDAAWQATAAAAAVVSTPRSER